MMIHINPESTASRLRIRHRNVRLRLPRATLMDGELSTAQRQKFLSALARAGSLEEALRLTGIDRASILALRAQDALFAQRWETVQDQRIAQIEAMLLDKAIEGLTRTDVLAADKTAEAAMRYSTNLGMWLLEARMPHRYAKGTTRAAATPRAEAEETPKNDPAAAAARIGELIAAAEQRLCAAEQALARGEEEG